MEKSKIRTPQQKTQQQVVAVPEALNVIVTPDILRTMADDLERHDREIYRTIHQHGKFIAPVMMTAQGTDLILITPKMYRILSETYSVHQRRVEVVKGYGI